MELSKEFDNALSNQSKQLIKKAKTYAKEKLNNFSLLNNKEKRRALLRQMAADGFSGIEVPEKYGGQGANFSTRVRVCEELAMADAGFAFSLINHHNVTSRVANFGTQALREKFLPQMLEGHLIACTAMTEPQSGSDFGALASTAEKVNGAWQLNGEKTWISNAAFADLLLTYAQTDNRLRARGVAGFIVQAKNNGFKRVPLPDVGSINVMEVGGFRLSNYLATDDEVLYPAPGGFFAAMGGVNQARIHVAALSAGMVHSALLLALAYTAKRTSFGQPLIQHQGLKWHLVDVKARLTALRLLVYKAAKQYDQGEDVQELAAIAKKLANEFTGPAIETCMRAMGAESLRTDFNLMRFAQYAKAFCFTDGTVEMMNERIGHLISKPFLND